MRLLNVQKIIDTRGLLQPASPDVLLEEFFDADIPAYGILSHTWGGEEVTFRDLDRQTNYKSKAGWAKIESCAEVAQQQSLQYIWVDTCCIDKSSSAELSESLNSMYHWYARATVCYAYLDDLHARAGDIDLKASLGVCRWFTRGWTLQELVASRMIRFYNASWQTVGTKHSLIRVLGAITGIPDICLTGSHDIQSQTVAERMSWAARRKTTRVEDQAYCLLGIFNVNMPLLYGEGHRAFLRLQAEILKESEDQTMLAWGLGMGVCSEIPGGLLATSPALFASCGRGRLAAGLPKWFTPLKAHTDTPWAMTSRGLHVCLPVSLYQSTPSLCYVLLHCTLNEDEQQDNGNKGPYALLIPLVRDGAGRYTRPPLLPPSLVAFECLNSYMRQELESMSLYWARYYIDQHPSRRETDMFSLHFDDLVSAGFELQECYPPAIVRSIRGNGSVSAVKCYWLGSFLFRFADSGGRMILLRLKPPSYTDKTVEPCFYGKQNSGCEGIWDLCHGGPQYPSRFPGRPPSRSLVMGRHVYSVRFEEDGHDLSPSDGRWGPRGQGPLLAVVLGAPVSPPCRAPAFEAPYEVEVPEAQYEEMAGPCSAQYGMLEGVAM